MNPIASQLNEMILSGNSNGLAFFSAIGKELFFPKGILSQSAEAKQKAHHINATIGIATEKDDIMCFDSIMDGIRDIRARESLTYAPSFGIPALRQKWRESLYEKNPSISEKTISLPVVTCGITHSISIFSDLFIDPGDVVVAPEMMWGNYNLIMGLRKGAVFNHFQMFSEQGGFNINGFEAALKTAAGSKKKVIVLLNFPHNPSGYTITQKEADQLEAIIVKTAQDGTNVIVACDDAYFGLFYEADVLGESLFSRLVNRHPQLMAVKLDGATKENFVWGLRVGFVTFGTQVTGDPAPFYEALEKKAAGAVRGNISNASHLGQSLVLKSMTDTRFPKEKEEKFQILAARAKKVKEVSNDPKYRDAWSVYPFNSGYFMCLKLKGVESETLRVHLLDHYGVGLIALGKNDLRVAFSCLEMEQIPELFDIIQKGSEALRKG